VLGIKRYLQVNTKAFALLISPIVAIATPDAGELEITDISHLIETG
jgi:hypothetical protein